MLETNELEKQSAGLTPPSTWNPLATIQRCWKWALPTGIVLACLAAIATWQTYEPTYRAEHLLEESRDYLVFKNVNPTAQDLAASERDFLLSAIVLDSVLADPDLRTAPSLADPESASANLRKGLSIDSGGTKTRMVVSYVDMDPQAAAMICNAVVASYLEQRMMIDAKGVINLEGWIAPEIHRWESQVEQRQRKVEQLSKILNVHVPGDLGEAEGEFDVQFITRIRSQITGATVKFAMLDAQLAFEASNNAEKTEPEYNEAMQRQRDLLSAELKGLQSKYDEEKQRLEQFGGHVARLQFAQAELEVANEVLGKLRSRVAAIRTERSQVTSVRSLAPATVPKEPIDPPLFDRMAFAGATGFCLPWLFGIFNLFASKTTLLHFQIGTWGSHA